MKTLRMELKERKVRRTEEVSCVKGVTLRSNWFRCRECDYPALIKTPADTAKCPQCGSIMDRV